MVKMFFSTDPSSNVFGVMRFLNKTSKIVGVWYESCGSSPLKNLKGCTPKSNRIINGVAVEEGEIPWQVSVINEYERLQMVTDCGGSIIGTKHVLTAAHCFEGLVVNGIRHFPKFELIYVFAGGKTDSESGQKYNIKKVVVHERFRRTTAGVVNDIAVITMKTEFEFGSNIQPICLPFMKSSVPDSGSTVIASGWGNTKPKTPSCSPNLLRADLQIFDFENSLCKNFIHNFSPKYSVLCVHSILSCTCDGDSGGPLTMEVDGVCTLVGITSQGFQCGIEGYGSLHMNVSYYLDWIIDNISVS
ncbi:hypodermin-A-like [Lepeophtheirus salmonis]|uniref:hypodermin-A-like n=1 Tax=Lepeophtheirus salmonis TaxID=72036 RepID=UPI003AF3AB15